MSDGQLVRSGPLTVGLVRSRVKYTDGHMLADRPNRSASPRGQSQDDFFTLVMAWAVLSSRLGSGAWDDTMASTKTRERRPPHDIDLSGGVGRLAEALRSCGDGGIGGQRRRHDGTGGTTPIPIRTALERTSVPVVLDDTSRGSARC
jgi:hypothetical protein